MSFPLGYLSSYITSNIPLFHLRLWNPIYMFYINIAPFHLHTLFFHSFSHNVIAFQLLYTYIRIYRSTILLNNRFYIFLLIHHLIVPIRNFFLHIIILHLELKLKFCCVKPSHNFFVITIIKFSVNVGIFTAPLFIIKKFYCCFYVQLNIFMWFGGNKLFSLHSFLLWLPTRYQILRKFGFNFRLYINKKSLIYVHNFYIHTNGQSSMFMLKQKYLISIRNADCTALSFIYKLFLFLFFFYNSLRFLPVHLICSFKLNVANSYCKSLILFKYVVLRINFAPSKILVLVS